jgi:hypothetical protein
MSKKSSLTGLISFAAAVAGVGALAVYVVKLVKEKRQDVDGAVDSLLEFYSSKAAELDNIVRETEFRVAN